MQVLVWNRAALIPLLWEKAGGVCPLCDKPLDLKRVQIDHIVPRVLGGTDEFDNLQVAHGRCNSLKGAKLLTDNLRAAIRSGVPEKLLRFLMRLPPPIHGKLVRLAQREHRSLHSQILVILERAVADEP